MSFPICPEVIAPLPDCPGAAPGQALGIWPARDFTSRAWGSSLSLEAGWILDKYGALSAQCAFAIYLFIIIHFEKGSLYISLAGPELSMYLGIQADPELAEILLALPPACWDERHSPLSCLAVFCVFFFLLWSRSIFRKTVAPAEDLSVGPRVP